MINLPENLFEHEQNLKLGDFEEIAKFIIRSHDHKYRMYMQTFIFYFVHHELQGPILEEKKTTSVIIFNYIKKTL